MRVIVALILCLMSAGAHAKHVMGVGGLSCGNWATTAKLFVDLKRENVLWLLGYLSAKNADTKGPDFLEQTDANSISGWMDHYCQQHPLDSVATAADELVKELVKRGGVTLPLSGRIVSDW